MSARNGRNSRNSRNSRSEFVANNQLGLQSKYYDKFWAVPSASLSKPVTAKTSAFTATEKAEKVMNLRSKSFKFRLNALLLIRAVFVWSVV